jgi:hypothetical protein
MSSMSDMNQQTLPLPNPRDWVSVAGAAIITRTSARTIGRCIRDGRLTGYLPFGATDKPANYILWRPQVTDYARSLMTVKAGVGK